MNIRTGKSPTPAYQFTYFSLKNKTYISKQTCLSEFIGSEPKGWVDSETAEQEILKALEDYRNE